jgi:thymidylate synthase (FAD)
MEFYIPEDAPETYKKSIEASKVAYNAALEAGMPREQARGILPLSIYTEFVWTASLQAVVHFCKLRKHTGAQKEIQQYAEAVEFLCRPQAPISWDALMSSEGV